MSKIIDFFNNFDKLFSILQKMSGLTLLLAVVYFKLVKQQELDTKLLMIAGFLMGVDFKEISNFLTKYNNGK